MKHYSFTLCFALVLCSLSALHPPHATAQLGALAKLLAKAGQAAKAAKGAGAGAKALGAGGKAGVGAKAVGAGAATAAGARRIGVGLMMAGKEARVSKVLMQVPDEARVLVASDAGDLSLIGKHGVEALSVEASTKSVVVDLSAAKAGLPNTLADLDLRVAGYDGSLYRLRNSGTKEHAEWVVDMADVGMTAADFIPEDNDLEQEEGSAQEDELYTVSLSTFVNGQIMSLASLSATPTASTDDLAALKGGLVLSAFILFFVGRHWWGRRKKRRELELG